MIHILEGILVNLAIGAVSGVILYTLHRIYEKVMK